MKPRLSQTKRNVISGRDNPPGSGRPPALLSLTHLCASAGCAAKLSQVALAELLNERPAKRRGAMDQNLLVGSNTFDDAGVYRLGPKLALVQTVDFFPPIVDDAYAYGQIAAANALSDVYAMGGRPLTAMNLLGVPTDKVPAGVVAAIVRGGAEKVAEAGAVMVGGHTIRSPEPLYGLSVTGTIHPERILTNAAARPGDLLVLTKPLGTGIATTAIKRDLASRQLRRQVVQVMTCLNTPGADLAEKKLIHCATDITGFGLIGHLMNIVRGSGVGAEVVAGSVPVLSNEILNLIQQDCIPGGTKNNRIAAEEVVDWTNTPETLRHLLTDAQTSGGLLLCVAPKRLAAVKKVLGGHRTLAAVVIGRITRGPVGRILVGA